MSPKFSPTAVAAILDNLSLLTMIPIDRDIVKRALYAHAMYGVRFYDGMILATAERGGCKALWSEDFNAGQEYFGITVHNPFV